ncbi:MAG: hypothetical protein H6766_01785 [Candidatus Peribacteria bacterium]|nr:MAG: hypothetical protein H6766_01785 [Candidatus Peribacteria bacterium]
MTFDELTQVKNPLFQTIHSLMMKQQTPLFKTFLRHQSKKGSQVIFFQRSTPQVQIGFDTEIPYIRDITNRIELQLDEETISKCHQLLKNQKTITRLNKDNKSIDQNLRDDFVAGNHRLIHNKPYLVYDIETTYATNNLRDAKFLIAYVINSDPDGTANFQHIPDIRAEQLFDYMLNFNGYIIGYNHV